MRALTFAAGYGIDDYNALIAGRQLYMANAFTIALNNGTVLYYTDAQRSFTAPPVSGSPSLVTYQAGQVLISGLKFKASAAAARIGADPTVSIEVDEQTVTFTPAPGVQINGQPWLLAVGQGALDAASINRDRWFFASPGGPPVCGMPLFWGVTSSIDKLSRTQAAIKVKSQLVLLDIQMPRNIYQPNCNYTVYDTDCGLNPASLTTSGAVGAGSTKVAINWSGAASGYTIGKITFATGLNVGLARTVRVATGSQLLLAYPLPFAPATGDEFTVVQGCDRTYARCTALGNSGRFRGYPFVPASEQAF